MMKRNTATMDPRNRLRDVPGFRELSERTLARIDALATEVTLDKGHLLTRQGNPGREAFVIVEGTAAFWRTGEACSVLTAGALVGELALLDGEPRSGNVVAVTPLRVLVFNPAEFHSLCDDLAFDEWMRDQAVEHQRA